MKSEYLKNLWSLRFEKLKKLEEDAAWKYQEILDECLENDLRDEQIVDLLHQLVKEERHHAKLAEELIEICRRNHTECGMP